MSFAPFPSRPRCGRLLAFFSLAFAAILACSPRASAQWTTESYPLVAGWNAIWLPLDCSYDTVGNVLGSGSGAYVAEVWRWNPLDSTTQFVTSPSSPISPDLQWAVWRRGDPINSGLGQLTGNAAYLIKVDDGTQPFTLQLKGRPLLPAQTWKKSGLNFFGFPLAGTPTFSNFLSKSADLKNGPALYQYVGGPLSDVPPKNPMLVSSPATTTMSRGSAYWIQSNSYSVYNGPLAVTVSSGSGLDFGETGTLATVHVVNAADPASQTTIGVTLSPLTSDGPPAGQEASSGSVPLRLQGALDPATSTFAYSDLTGPITRTLAPGASTDFVVAVNRTALGTTAGAVFQSLMQVSDSLGFTRINVPVRAVATSFAGLWVGVATVTNVDQILSRGGTDSVGLAQPSSPFPIRLLLHSDGSVNTFLSQVFLGDSNGAPVASVNEGKVEATSVGRVARLTTASFPIEIVPPTTGGGLGSGAALTYTITLAHNSPTNPFLHAYHPDHDGLDVRYNPLPAGVETFDITRKITLTFQPTLTGVSDSDPTWGSTTLGGNYTETIQGLRHQNIGVGGTFVLHRVSTVPALTPP